MENNKTFHIAGSGRYNVNIDKINCFIGEKSIFYTKNGEIIFGKMRKP
ncbi:MAG: hypothetical protein HFI65_08070 [Lachnospiraceae bacterium]|nr:hypothetical protein [Lachnospiraceae bacterium]